MNILVTGASGFIGKRLVSELINNGYNVRVYLRKPIHYYDIEWANQVIAILGDITDRDAIRKAVHGVDVVIHLAAQLGAWKAKQSDYIEVNVEGTKLLVDESKKAGVQHFIYVSTCGVFGTLQNIPADELHPCAPRYPYEKTKYIAEQYIQSAIQEGFPATILRPSHVYGPGDLNTVPLIKLLKIFHFFPLLGGGKSYFQPVFIDDLTKGIVLCLKNRNIVLRKIYILSGKEAITFQEYIDLIAKIMKINIITIPFSYGASMMCANINESLAKLFHIEPILNRFRIDFFSGYQYYDIQKAQHDFSYNPEIKIKDGMEMALKWYKKSGLI